ncbi:uncharacterized protein CDV56_107660 [Aspergillus thermomutatus]|uniref:Uncharacterized protein n=1 Tax=Aspergillus thermomutatus TaxID=41047 RepID=A0A397H3F3_ASPTH|nr:uncharacterized protein CDV56_107660 [Aspergillus thermomutatus]RHZ56166.1 hypothetical protein CDV56_107660 [Aspergillus thermomutatus]
MEDYSEELQKKISGLGLGSSKDEVRDVWKRILEYHFPKQSADCLREGFIHKYFNYDSDFPHIGIVNPRAAAAETLLPGSRTDWQALEDAVKFELVGIMSLIKECKPNFYAAIVAGPLVRFCGVNKKGEFWDFGFDDEEGAWNIHHDYDAILEGLLKIRAKIDPVCFVPFGVSTVCIKEEAC